VSKGKSALGIVRKYHPQVNKVVDATKKVQIEVTAKDCRSGKRKGPSSCAMARAFEREYDGAIISLAVAYLIKGDKATRYRVPENVSREIVSFDRSKQFDPGTYTLTAPAGGEKLGPRRSRLLPERHAKKYSQHKPRNSHKTAGIRSL
jgi:hypothetical protein